MSVHIVTDSTSDIPKSLVEQLPITVVPLYIVLNGESFLDNVDISRSEFYQALPDSEPYATTATPSTDQFQAAFDVAVEKGASAIFSIHISESLSATIKTAQSAAQSYDRVPVQVIDSGNLSMAEGLIVITAAQAAKDGKSPEEVKAIIESVIPRTHAYAKLDTIDYLLRGGRMSAIQYSVVSLLGIKPILKMNNHVSRMEIARTKRKAFERVVNTAVENIPYADVFGITHAGVPDQVDELIRNLKEMIPELPDPLVSDVTPALGVHVGPGTLCINWIECKAHAECRKKGLLHWFTENFPGQRA
jgi:DegV family protein with EDD domain